MEDVSKYSGTKDVSVLQNIRDEMNTLHKEIKEAMETAFQKALRLGELLTCVKATLPHGEYIKWVEKNCNFSIRATQRYMKLHEDKEKLLENGVSSLASAYKLIGNKSKYATVSHLKNQEDSFDEDDVVDADFTFEEVDESKELAELYKKIEFLTDENKELNDSLSKYQYQAHAAKKELEERNDFYNDPNVRDAIKNMALANKNLDRELPKVAEIEKQVKSLEKFCQKGLFQIAGIEVEDVHKEIFQARIANVIKVLNAWNNTMLEKYGIDPEETK
jgi:hypothetical protein